MAIGSTNLLKPPRILAQYRDLHSTGCMEKFQQTTRMNGLIRCVEARKNIKKDFETSLDKARNG